MNREKSHADQRVALEKLRKIIHTVAPEAEECISSGLAAFRMNGRPLVAFGAQANHYAFYPMRSAIVKAFQDRLTGFETSKGTIRFSTDKPLPTAMVKKLVKARIAAGEVCKFPSLIEALYKRLYRTKEPYGCYT